MQTQHGVKRVIVVVLDGLRADAIPLFPLLNLSHLARNGAATLTGRTVSPSITTSALTSLMTGVSPRVHGLESDRISLPRNGSSLRPLPNVLQDHGVATRGYIATPPRPFRGLAQRIAARAGAALQFGGEHADQILERAMEDLDQHREGYFFLHWPDVDRAGHASGWTSKEYVAAARRMDGTLGSLVARTGLLEDLTTVLIALSDHGGGGINRNDHNSLHPLDTTIPIILAGGGVACGELVPTTSLLDIPATVSWLLTGSVPTQYQGRVLVEAFDDSRAPALVAQQ